MAVPTTFGSLGILLIAVAPGLLFEVGLARRLNYLRRPLADRLLRFVAWSLMFNVLLLPGTVAVAKAVPREVGAVSGGGVLLIWMWALSLTVLPYALGSWAAQRAGWLRTALLGRDPAPLAWHLLWEDLGEVEGVYVRVRLRESGSWVAGLWSYSSDEPEDLLLSPRVLCDPSTGELDVDPASGVPTVIEWGMLLRTSDLDIIEVQS